LVKNACAQYDEGAQCFATAASLPLTWGPDVERRFTEALDCGFGSSKASEALVNATIKGDEIKSQIG
jgi:hypothetical protein